MSVPLVGAGIAELEYVFNPSRGRPEDLDATLTGRGAALSRGHVVKIPVDRFDEQGFVLYGLGEPLELVKILARGPDGEVSHVLVPREGSCPEDLDDLLEVGPAGGSGISGPGAFMDEVDEAIDARSGSPLCQYQRFFAELSRYSHPVLLDHLARRGRVSLDAAVRYREAIRSVTLTLLGRVQRRAHGEDPSTGAEMDADVRDVSRLLLVLVSRHFSLPNGAIHPGGFQRAFECFANGDLRLQTSGGAWALQPSSGYFFFFAEFALFAISLGMPEKDEWARLVAAMVRPQEIFMEVYGPADRAGADFDSYSACRFAACKQYSPERMRELRTRMPLERIQDCEQAASENSRKAFGRYAAPP